MYNTMYTQDGKTASEENGGTMDDCAYSGHIIAVGERYTYIYLYKTMGKITEACKTSEKTE